MIALGDAQSRMDLSAKRTSGTQWCQRGEDKRPAGRARVRTHQARISTCRKECDLLIEYRYYRRQGAAKLETSPASSRRPLGPTGRCENDCLPIAHHPPGNVTENAPGSAATGRGAVVTRSREGASILSAGPCRGGSRMGRARMALLQQVWGATEAQTRERRRTDARGYSGSGRGTTKLEEC